MSGIAVYVINLARRPDRLEAVGQRLAAAGVGFQRVDATDARACDPTELEQSLRSGPIGALGDGARACTASHFRAWRKLLDSAHSHALILEDDVEVDPALADILTDPSWLCADLVKVEKFNADRPSRLLLGRSLGMAPGGRDLRPLLSRHTGSAGYIISRRGAEVALAHAGRVRVPVDHFLFNATVSEFSASIAPAILVQPVVWQSIEVGGTTDIVNARAQLPRWQRWRRSLVRAWHEVRLLPWQVALLLSGRGKVVTVQVSSLTS